MAGFFRWLGVRRNLTVCLISLLPIIIAYLMVTQYGVSRIPSSDQWFISLDIATKVKQNTLTFLDLFRQHGAHRHVWYNAWTAFLAQTTNWDLSYEGLFPIGITLIKYIIFLVLIWKTHRKLFSSLIVPFAILIFHSYQPDIWLFPFNISWNLVSIALLGSLLVMVSNPPGWKPFLAIFLITVGGTLAAGTALVQWGIIPVVLWLYGYRRWQYFALWIPITIVIVALYRSPIGGISESYQNLYPWWNQTALPNPILGIYGFFAAFGVPILGEALPPIILFVMGGFGLFLLALNTGYMLYSKQTLKGLTLWIALAGFSISTIFLIMLGRGHLGIIWMVTNRYMNITVWAWISLLCLIALNRSSLSLEKRVRFRRFLTLNRVSSMVIIILALFTNLFYFASYVYIRNTGIRLPPYPDPADEACLRRYPLMRDCVPLDGHPDLYYQIPLYHLNIYDDFFPVNILPKSYVANSPMIVHSPSRWLNLYIRDWMLPTLSEKDLFHVAPPEELVSTNTFPRPLERVIANYLPENLTAVRQFIGNAPVIWYITTPEVAADDLMFFEMMESAGYLREEMPVDEPYYRGSKFQLFRFTLDRFF
jgi:hypothetical protein